jgi:HPt (histidine-containing phosphotransfer) domain-containing protein
MTMAKSQTEDVFMAELKGEFLAKSRRDLVDLHRLLAAGELAEIARIAHDIKGTAGLFGFHEATAVARDLQSSARGNELDRTAALIGQLDAILTAAIAAEPA